MAELRAYNPTLGDKLRWGTQDLMHALGMPVYEAGKVGRGVEEIGNMLPLVSNVLGGSQMAKAQDEGDWLGALAGAIQGAGGPAGAIFLGPLGMAKAGIQSVAQSKAMQEGLRHASSLDKVKYFRKFRQNLGADGKLRGEFSDAGARLDTPYYDETHGVWRTQLVHPEMNLHSIYGIPDFTLGQDKSAAGMRGWFTEGAHPAAQLRLNSPGSNFIEAESSISYPPVLSTALHEMQHAIQSKEGFAGGAAPAAAVFHPEFWQALGVDDFSSVPSGAMEDVFRKVYKETSTGKNTPAAQAALDVYRRVMGEVESRNVQKRALDPDLAWLSPETTEDVPRKHQINLDNIMEALRYGR